jgi:hypothetical protein
MAADPGFVRLWGKNKKNEMNRVIVFIATPRAKIKGGQVMAGFFGRGFFFAVFATAELLACFGLAAEEQRQVVEKWSSFSVASQKYVDEVRGVSMTSWSAGKSEKGLVLRIRTTFDTNVKVPIKNFSMTYAKSGKRISTNCVGMTAGIRSESVYPTWMLETGNITNTVFLSKGPALFELLFSVEPDVKEVSILYNDQVLVKKLKLK